MMLGSDCSACCCPGQGGVEVLQNAESLTANVSYTFAGQMNTVVYDYSFSGDYTLTRISAGVWSTDAFEVVGQGGGGSQTRSMSLSANLFSLSYGNNITPLGYSDSSVLGFRLNRLTKVGDTVSTENWPEQGHIGFAELTCSKRPVSLDPDERVYARSYGSFESFWINEVLDWGQCFFTITRDGVTAYKGECKFGWGGNGYAGPSIAPYLYPQTFNDTYDSYNVLSNICGTARSTGGIGGANNHPVSVRLQWEKGDVFGAGFPPINAFLSPIRYDEQLTVNSLEANFDGYSQNMLMNVRQTLWRPETMEMLNVYVPGLGGSTEFLILPFAGVPFNTVSSQCQQ